MTPIPIIQIALLGLILLCLTFIFIYLRKWYRVFMLLSFSIKSFEEINHLVNRATQKRMLLKQQKDKSKKKDQDAETEKLINYQGKEIPYSEFIKSIEHDEKSASIFLEANFKAKSGLSFKNCMEYVEKRFAEEKINYL